MFDTCILSLFPVAKRQGEEFVLGSLNGERGTSLKINVNTGLWQDFSTLEKGNIQTLVQKVKGLSYREACEFLEPFGVENPHKKNTYYNTNGERAYSFVRKEEQEGKKFYPDWTEAPQKRLFFNQHLISEFDNICFVEGEKCARILTDFFQAKNLKWLGITTGGVSSPLQKFDWTLLSQKKVCIWPDNDIPGHLFASKVANFCNGVVVSPEQGIINKFEKSDCADFLVDQDECVLQKFEEFFLKQEQTQEQTQDDYLTEKGAFLWLSELGKKEFQYNKIEIFKGLLGSGELCVLAGNPKVGKTSFVMSLILHAAFEKEYLFFKTVRPIKILFLQSELNFFYLQQRFKELSEYFGFSLEDSANQVLIQNFNITTFSENGMFEIEKKFKTFSGLWKQNVQKDFDLIVVDPLRNYFYGENESCNQQIMEFLTNGLERVRQVFGKQAGVLLIHHLRKTNASINFESDPFQTFAGGSALRGFYSSGFVLAKKKNQFFLYGEARNSIIPPKKELVKKGVGFSFV